MTEFDVSRLHRLPYAGSPLCACDGTCIEKFLNGEIPMGWSGWWK